MPTGLPPKVTAAMLTRLGVAVDSNDPMCLLFKCVSDNGANIKSSWDNGGRWVPCFDHTTELVTLPFTWAPVKKKEMVATIPKGSVAESFAKGRGIVGFLHVSPNAEADFHTHQKACGLPENKIDQDVKTRWRTAHGMGKQLVFNKQAVLRMDAMPAYKDPGETWGKNKLTYEAWDHLEESAACLHDAAYSSQMGEGDKYPTASLVVPMVYKLIATSAASHDVTFHNRDKDKFNDPNTNPVKVPHANLNPKVREAREKMHSELIRRFQDELPLSVKKFWFVSSMLDPCFKKLTFKHDRFLVPQMRRDAEKWLTEEFIATSSTRTIRTSLRCQQLTLAKLAKLLLLVTAEAAEGVGRGFF